MMMTKTVVYLILLVAALIGIGIAAHFYRVYEANKHEMDKYNLAVMPDFKVGKTLVVYYSLGGRTKAIAQQIAELTGGDLYEIRTKETFTPDLAFYLKVREQLHSKKYPEIVNDIPDFRKYDTIFVGGPVWWYAPATPLLAFLKKANFRARRVVPFSTQGSNFGSFFIDFNRNVEGAKLRPSASFNNLPAKYDRQVRNKIIQWINSIE